MLYKLALSYTPLSTFNIAARATRSNEPTMTAQFKDDEAFLRVLGEASLTADEYARLTFATMTAVTWPEMGVCCEEVSLEDWQVRMLHLTPLKQHVA
jgi:hypothetical protein